MTTAARPSPWTLDTTDLRTFSLDQIREGLTDEDAWENSGKNSWSLVRSPQMRSVVVALDEGSVLHDHVAPGPVCVTPLEGRVTIGSEDGCDPQELSPGDVAFMTADARHGLRALERSIVLVVIGGDAADTE